jgi:hypothetical protein
MPRATLQCVAFEEEACAIETVFPRVNMAFLEELMTYEEFHQTQWWGDNCFAEIFKEMLQVRVGVLLRSPVDILGSSPSSSDSVFPGPNTVLPTRLHDCLLKSMAND